MSVLLTGLALFVLSFLIHIVIWKVHMPGRQTRALLRIFFVTPAAGLTALWFYHSFFTRLGLPVLSGYFEFLHTFLLHTSLALAYITTYSGMEVDSPSLVMTKMVAEAGEEGLPEEDFFASLSDDILVKPRVRDLLRDELAHLEDGKYRISPKGARIARIFLFYRKLLNVSGKGG